MSYAEARVELEKLGFVLKEPEYEYNDTVTIHHVISSLPPADTPMAPGDSVQLVVSRGPGIKLVTVPSLYTLTRSQAEKVLKDYNLKCNVIEVNNSEEAGKVINQSIAPGTEVEAGTTITIQVSKGPSENPGGNGTKTKNISINLPRDKEMVTVQVLVDGAEKYNNSVSTASGSLTVSLEGKGKQEVIIYLDGMEYDKYELDFNP
jgi:serine/threonine-protein kinase